MEVSTPEYMTAQHNASKTRRMSKESAEVTRDFIAGMGLLSSGVPGGYQVRGDGVVLNVIELRSPSTNTLHILQPIGVAKRRATFRRACPGGSPSVRVARQAERSGLG